VGASVQKHPLPPRAAELSEVRHRCRHLFSGAVAAACSARTPRTRVPPFGPMHGRAEVGEERGRERERGPHPSGPASKQQKEAQGGHREKEGRQPLNGPSKGGGPAEGPSPAHPPPSAVVPLRTPLDHLSAPAEATAPGAVSVIRPPVGGPIATHLLQHEIKQVHKRKKGKTRHKGAKWGEGEGHWTGLGSSPRGGRGIGISPSGAQAHGMSGFGAS